MDKKSELPKLERSNEVKLVERIEANWGDFSLVQATLNLLSESIHTSKADYFCLLSGSDYPVQSSAKLAEKLSRERGEYINLKKVPLPGKPLDRFDRHYFRKNMNRSSSPGHKLLTATEKVIYALGVRKTLPFEIYAGSQWFTLSRDCVYHILNEVEDKPQYINFFRKTVVPDESFFHTIIGHSLFVERVRHNLTYARWTGGSSPEMIDENTVCKILEQQKCRDGYGSFEPFFARKFSDDLEGLVGMIDWKVLRSRNINYDEIML